MENIVTDRPNLVPETVPVENVSTGLDAIAQKMAAMKEMTMRNQMKATEQTEAGSTKAAAKEAPVAPEGVKVDDNDVSDSDTDLVEPEVEATDAENSYANEEAQAPEEVSPADTSSEELIDFLDFANENPNAKFKFMRNGKEVVVDAKKAAAILGQGAAISEDARQLKIEKAEFDEYLQTKRAESEGLLLAMEFTIQPQLQKAYDEIVKVQGYQTTFQQQLAQAQDPGTQARIRANMQRNEQYIQQQSQLIQQLKPRVDEFYNMRSQQVQQVLDNNRKGFKDSELKNSVIYNEIRDKVAKGWSGAQGQLVPGIKNIDLISSDEHLMSLLRDGLKYRDKPATRSAGSSIAALTGRKGGTTIASRQGNQLSDLEQKAKAGDRKAQDNLLVAKMQALRSQRR